MSNLNLPLKDGKKLMINSMYFRKIWDELEEFLEDEDGMNNIDFVKRILFNLEIKSNNTVEGINDDLEFIENVIKNTSNITNDEKRKRIINLYNGYKYILKNKTIDEEHLKELYNILSNGLLSKNDLSRMGKYYRKAPVYILKKGRLDLDLDEGLPYKEIPKFMDSYFEFSNEKFNGTITEQFIKSQIMHFYFVYIHPYFDVNGRTSRTLAMWQLLNQGSYPYIIFNRAINFADSSYDEIIGNCKEIGNVSFFIKYMMENVKVELEKEMIMREIKKNTETRMTAMDFQALHYILSMNGEVNVLTFSTMYRERNGKKPVRDIYEEIIDPLIEKDILLVDRVSKKKMFDNYGNEVLKINNKKYNKDNPKIKKLKLDNK